MADDPFSLAARSEIQSAHRSLKMVRAVCKEYKLGFHMPPGVFSSSTAMRCAKPPEEEDGAESSSSSDFSSEDDKNSLGHHAKWESIKEMLDNIDPDKRVKTLRSIQRSMAVCSETASQHLQELEALEKAAGYSSDGSGGEEDKDTESDPLLKFDANDMPVAHAIRRCVEVVPGFRQQALAKIKAREIAKAEEERLKAELEREAQQSDEDSPEERKEGLSREVAKKLHKYGVLPLSADPDLQRILEAQRKEVHRLVQQITECEKEEKIKKLAQRCIEGNTTDVDPVDAELLPAAQSLAQELKAGLLAERRAEAERKYREERPDADVPTDDEIRASVEEFHRLQEEVEAANEKIKRFLELEKEQYFPPAALQPPAAAGGERPPSKHPAGSGDAPKLPFAVEDAPEVHKKLMGEVKQLEAEIAREDKRIEVAEGVIRNVEHTLRTLEETKAIFLERIAEERPALLQHLISPDGEGSDSEDNGEAYGGDGEDGMNDETDKMQMLADEEKWLRTQLKESQDNLADLLEGEMSGSLGASSFFASDSQDWTQDPLVTDIQRLVYRVEAACKGQPLPDESDDSDSEDDLTVGAMTSEAAIQQLRSMPHQHLKELVQVQEENEKLVQKLQKEQQELEYIRMRLGNPEGLLKPGSTMPVPNGVSPEMIVEVRRKCRELMALRRRWWHDRQDPSTTVRRALAVTDLPEDVEAEDEPPTSVKASLFERIHSSTTMP